MDDIRATGSDCLCLRRWNFSVSGDLKEIGAPEQWRRRQEMRQERRVLLAVTGNVEDEWSLAMVGAKLANHWLRLLGFLKREAAGLPSCIR